MALSTKAQVHAARASTGRRGGEQRGQPLPLGIAQIAEVRGTGHGLSVSYCGRLRTVLRGRRWLADLSVAPQFTRPGHFSHSF